MREVVEVALAHAIENKIEAAYRRGHLLEKRRVLMANWASFVQAPPMPLKEPGQRRDDAPVLFEVTA